MWRIPVSSETGRVYREVCESRSATRLASVAGGDGVMGDGWWVMGDASWVCCSVQGVHGAAQYIPVWPVAVRTAVRCVY